MLLLAFEAIHTHFIALFSHFLDTRVPFFPLYTNSSKFLVIYLSNFGVQESYKGKRSEWLRYKDIGDLAKLGKIFTQIIRSHVFSTSANKHFAWNLWIISFLQWLWYMISKHKYNTQYIISTQWTKTAEKSPFWQNQHFLKNFRVECPLRALCVIFAKIPCLPQRLKSMIFEIFCSLWAFSTRKFFKKCWI